MKAPADISELDEKFKAMSFADTEDKYLEVMKHIVGAIMADREENSKTVEFVTTMTRINSIVLLTCGKMKLDDLPRLSMSLAYALGYVIGHNAGQAEALEGITDN